MLRLLLLKSLVGQKQGKCTLEQVLPRGIEHLDFGDYGFRARMHDTRFDVDVLVGRKAGTEEACRHVERHRYRTERFA